MNRLSGRNNQRRILFFVLRSSFLLHWHRQIFGLNLFGNMITRATIFSFFTCLLLWACKSPSEDSASERRIFQDPGGRVVTVERWASAAGFAVAWAVYPDRIVVFTMNDFSQPERVISEHLIDASAFARVQDEINGLPSGLRGKHFKKKGIHDGIFFRISFSPGGKLTLDRIEFENMCLPEVVPLLAAINGQIPVEERIHYEISTNSIFGERETIVQDVYIP